jgi:hypothetical protein
MDIIEATKAMVEDGCRIFRPCMRENGEHGTIAVNTAGEGGLLGELYWHPNKKDTCELMAGAILATDWEIAP